MQYALGIDLGTSYFKFGLFDDKMELKGLGRIEVQKDMGAGHLCELPTERFRDLIATGIETACKNADAQAGSIVAIGYSSQANSFLILDKNDNPLTPLILWPDARCELIFPELEKLRNDPDFAAVTGIGTPPSAGSCANKLLWFKHEHSELWRRAGSVMTISDYLVHIFTGEKLGDTGTASLLGMMDCRKGGWWNKAFDILGFERNLFVPLSRPGTRAGTAMAELAGIKQGTPFFLGGLDHHMAAFGAKLNPDFEVSESTGTVTAAVCFTDRYAPDRHICIAPWKKPGSYCRLAFDNNGAASLEWYRKQFAPDISIRELIAMAERRNSAAGLKAMPEAFACNDRLKAFAGISGSESHGNFVYALMESVTYTLKALLAKLCPDRKPTRVVSTGGGAESPFWLKMKSEIIGIPFIASDTPELACRGAAMTAFLGQTNSGCGYF